MAQIPNITASPAKVNLFLMVVISFMELPVSIRAT
jgi:hypothetical protein